MPLADGAAFRRFAVPGAAKLLLGFTVRRAGAVTTLTTLTRVACSDDGARRRLAAYWAVVRPVSGLMRRRILADIRRHAEAA
jgi:hypothetical protein